MAKKRYVTLQIIPDDSTETWTFRVRYVFFEFLFYAGVIALLALALASVKVTQINAKLLAGNHLASENKRLVEQQKKMVLLEDQLAQIAEREKAIRSLLHAFVAEDSMGQTTQESRSTGVIPDLGKYLARVRDLERQMRGKKSDGMRDHVPDIWPVAGIVSRGFRRSPRPDQNHEALDIVAPENALISAAAKGIVTAAGLDPDLGHFVRIDHDFGVETVYGHLSQALVQVGDHLDKGTALGLVGNSGNSMGPHLHYEIIFKGQPVDPMKYLR
jgi:murein DD-endopeptidase MepM/ murein hydrolase activator NlpD